MEGFEEQDPLSAALSSRRIPHGRFGKNHKGRNGGSAKTFDPMRSIGVYEVRHGSGSKTASSHSQDGAMSHFSIHSLTGNEDGLIASFAIDGVHGMAVLAGGRKTLKEICLDLERSEDDPPHASAESPQEDDGSQSGRDENPQDEQDDEETSLANEVEMRDDRLNQRTKAFEKNSFRNPKFWLCWRGHVSSGETESDEENVGYLIFTGNDCSKFQATITSKARNWDNRKFSGYKVKSHVGSNTFNWLDFDV